MANNFNHECLTAHNTYRVLHQVAPLTFAADLAKQAQAWADKIAKQDNLEHSDSAGKYGENVAMKFISGTFEYTGQQATDQWYSEIRMYDFKGPENQIKCGHFSQVVWKDSKEAGFGIATAKSGKKYVVGQYRPPANYMNQWHKNVLPTKDGKFRVPSEDEIMGRPEGASNTVSTSSGGPNAKDEKDHLTSRSTRTKIENDTKTITVTETYEKPNGEKYDVTIVTTEKEGSKPVTKITTSESKPVEEAKPGSAKKPDNIKHLRNEVLDAHNKHRKNHGAGILVINKELNKIAQKWATHLAKNNKFEHSSNTLNGSRLGENIAAKWSSQTSNFPGDTLVQQWYDEEPHHVYDKNPTVLKSGHFTQVVWKESRELGVGCALDSKGKVILVCNYFPAGNVMGKFIDNVGKAK